MNLVRTLLLCLVTLSLNMGGIAYASMPCCGGKTQQVSQGEGADMPCHETATQDQKTSKQANMDCNGCKCQHCTPLNAITSKISTSLSEITFTHPALFAEVMISQTVGYITPPPKS